MQNVMQNNCAVFRTQEVMNEGVAKMKEVTDATSNIRVSDRSMIWNSDLVETLEFENLVEQAAVTMCSAANRQESRGAHARDDIPDRDDENWMKHTIAWIDEDYNVKIDYRPVHMETLTNEIQPVPPKARVY
jgi:succinate dehydrogenase / fumarate reductase flavoprotein subunit